MNLGEEGEKFECVLGNKVLLDGPFFNTDKLRNQPIQSS